MKKKFITFSILILLTLCIGATTKTNVKSGVAQVTETYAYNHNLPESDIGKWAGGTGIYETKEEAEAADAAAWAEYERREAEVSAELGISPDGTSINSQPQSNNSSSTTNTTQNSSQNTSTSSLTLQEEELGVCVVLSKKVVYSSYGSTKEEIGYLYAGDEVIVTGITSNGYYRFSYTNKNNETVDAFLLYKDKDNIIDKETYETGWSETDRVESTCTEQGYIKYTNSYSNLTKKETLDLISHTRGELEYITEPTLFASGEAGYKCTVCGEILESYKVDPLVPIWLWILGGIVVIACGSILVYVAKSKSKIIKISDNS